MLKVTQIENGRKVNHRQSLSRATFSTFLLLCLSKQGLAQRIVIDETHFECPNMADSFISNGKHDEICGFHKTIIEKEANIEIWIPPFFFFYLCQVYIVYKCLKLGFSSYFLFESSEIAIHLTNSRFTLSESWTHYYNFL